MLLGQCGYVRFETEDMRQTCNTGDIIKRCAIGNRRQETGDWRCEKGGKINKIGDRIQQTCDRRCEAGDMIQKT